VLFIDGAHDCTVIGLTSYDAAAVGATTESTCLEIADDCYNITIESANCYGSGASGLSIHAHTGEKMPYNITVQNSEFHDNATNGIRVICNNGASDADAPSIVFDNVDIYDNTLAQFTVNKEAGGANYPKSVTLKNCSITDTLANVYTAIIYGADHLIKNTLFVGDNRGVYLENVGGTDFWNNTLYAPNGTAFIAILNIAGTSNSGLDIRNNIIATGSTGNLCIAVANGGTVGVTADYNLYYTPSGVGGNRWSWAGVNSTYANWKTNSSQDANSPTPADPLFTSIAGGDYTLQAGSPAINEGVDVGLYYMGAAPDLGYAEKA
jgi:hypothetical protein